MQKRTRKDLEIQPWDRQPGETAKAFEAFKAYRDLGSERSITKAAQALNKARATMGEWSGRWGWVERVAAYDRYLDRIEQEKAVKEYQKMIERHTRIAMSIQEKAVRALSELKEEDLTPSVLLAYLAKATEIERINRMSAAGIDEAGMMDTEIEIIIEDDRSAED